MSFLQLEDKTIVIFGVANRKSVAYHIGKTVEQAGATPVYVVRSEARKEQLQRLLADRPIYVCDVEFPEQIEGLRELMGSYTRSLSPITKKVRSLFMKRVNNNSCERSTLVAIH